MADNEILSRDERAALARASLVAELTAIRSRLVKCMGWAKMCGRDEIRFKLKVADEWLAEALDDAGLPRVEIVNESDDEETQPIESTFDTEKFEVNE